MAEPVLAAPTPASLAESSSAVVGRGPLCAAEAPDGARSRSSSDTCFLEELAKWSDPTWNDQLRAKLARAGTPGPCVLDLKPANMLNFAQSDWCLVERDLRAAFSPELSSRLEECLREEVSDCLTVRRELVNYKKLCLHLYQKGSLIEKDLKQLASFFFCDVVSDSTPKDRKQRYQRLATAMSECRGTVVAVLDARYMGKTICNLPRDPSYGIPWKFEDLPESLETFKALEQTRQFLRDYKAMDVYLAARGVNAPTDDHAVAPPQKPARQVLRWKSERELVLESTLVTSGLEALMTLVDNSCDVILPPPAREFLRRVLIARGAVKALTIRSALQRYCTALRRLLADAESMLKELLQLLETPVSESAMSEGMHIQCFKHRNVMRGVLSVVPSMLQWLEPIVALRSGAERLFVSGSKGAATFVPRGFPDFFRAHRTMVLEERGTMLDEFIAGRRVPMSVRPQHPEEEKHLRPCRKCGVQYTKLWLQRELCFACEHKLRTEGRCPFSDRCGKAAFCPHELRCVVCEQWSCEKCNLHRGDGEDVWQLAGHLKPDVVFLDFDRTLCTTKAGASPLEGDHSIDPDLASLCASHGAVDIVTRSSRTEDIQTFLKAKGVPIREVVSIKRLKLKGKADAIISALEQVSGAGLFVDDDIKELTDARIQALVDAGRLHRVLFVRASIDR